MSGRSVPAILRKQWGFLGIGSTFDLHSQPWKCHGACGCVIQFANVLQWVSLVAQLVKNWLAMWQTWVRSLGWKDPVEEGMANHSSFLAWRIPMD